MVNEAHKHNNRKSNGQNYVSRNKSTKASPPVANANVVINVDNAKQKLQELKSVYQQKVNFADTRGFLTDLRTALGIPNDRGASKYGVVKGGNFVASISLTNHNSNAQTYVDANANYPYNLRLMIRRRYRKNTFKPQPSVNLEEYVYFGQEMVKCTKGNPYLLIIDGIIEFLSKGQYEDKTGIAHKNQSSIITESKINKRIETWYRGFDKEYGVYGEETPHLLWLTTDLNYAKEYGDSIMEYKIDMSKCRGSIDGMGYLFDFDMSEGPSEEYASYLLNEYGVNSYRYYGGLTESSYCMCLWDETPIVSQRILDNNELNKSKNMKKNAVKINENTLRQIVAESVKKVLKEYHWDKPFDEEEMQPDIIDEALSEMERILGGIKSTLKLENYALIGIDGLDKERAIAAIKSIESGISILGMATYGIKN